MWQWKSHCLQLLFCIYFDIYLDTCLTWHCDLYYKQDKQQTPSKRAWEGIRKTHSPPSWVRKDLDPVQASPLELKSVEWEKASATIPLVGQEVIDLQTEVWPEHENTQ